VVDCTGRAYLGCNTAGITSIHGVRGTLTCLSTLTGLTDLYVYGECDCTVEGSNAITDVYVCGGIGRGHVAITDLRVTGNGGKWTQYADGGAITNLFVGPGATVVYNGTGTITEAWVMPGGTLDFTGDGREKTVTTLWALPGSIVKRTPRLIVTTQVM